MTHVKFLLVPFGFKGLWLWNNQLRTYQVFCICIILLLTRSHIVSYWYSFNDLYDLSIESVSVLGYSTIKSFSFSGKSSFPPSSSPSLSLLYGFSQLDSPRQAQKKVHGKCPVRQPHLCVSQVIKKLHFRKMGLFLKRPLSLIFQ
jgi:hypothetical protein